MDTDKQTTHRNIGGTTLPAVARHSLNRCNLPAVILGGLTFQQHPSPLYIDGVNELHTDLFRQLDAIASHEERAHYFIDYMSVHFRLHALGEAGFETEQRIDRSRANYQRLLRGWAFNPDGKEAAVLKRWVESRFGLVPRFHETAITSTQDESYQHYQQNFVAGLYNTNALEAQLDLLYSYSQYELHRSPSMPQATQLFRGINHIERLPIDDTCPQGQTALLLNNINSFSYEQERADEFDDTIISVSVPAEKIVFYSELLPGFLRGEAEVIVLGGVYCAKMQR